MKSDSSAEHGRQLSAENLKTFSALLSKAEHLPARQLEILDQVLKGETDIGKKRIGSLTEYFDAYSKNLDEIARKCSDLNDVYLILEQTSTASQERLLESFKAAAAYAEQTREIAKEAEAAARNAVLLTQTAQKNANDAAKTASDTVKELGEAVRDAEDAADKAKKNTATKQPAGGAGGGGDGGDDGEPPKKPKTKKGSGGSNDGQPDNTDDSTQQQPRRKKVSKQDRKRLNGVEPDEDYSEEYGPTPEQLERSRQRVRDNMIWLAQVVQDHRRDADQRAAFALEEAKRREDELAAYRYEQERKLTEKQKTLKKSLDKLFALSHQDEITKANRVAAIRMSKWQDVADAGIEAQTLINQLEAELAFSGEANFQEIVDTTPYPATPVEPVATTDQGKTEEGLTPVSYGEDGSGAQAEALEPVPYDIPPIEPIVDNTAIVETTETLIEQIGDLTEVTKQVRDALTTDGKKVTNSQNVSIEVTAQNDESQKSEEIAELLTAADELGDKLDDLTGVAGLIANLLTKAEDKAPQRQMPVEEQAKELQKITETATATSTEIVTKPADSSTTELPAEHTPVTIQSETETEASEVDHTRMFIDTTGGPIMVDSITSAMQKKLDEIDFTNSGTKPDAWTVSPTGQPVEPIVSPVVQDTEQPVVEETAIVKDTPAIATVTEQVKLPELPAETETLKSEGALDVEEAIKLFMSLLSTTIDSSIDKLVNALSGLSDDDIEEPQDDSGIDEISDALNGIADIQRSGTSVKANDTPAVAPEGGTKHPVQETAQAATADAKPVEAAEPSTPEQQVKVIAEIQQEPQATDAVEPLQQRLQPVTYDEAPEAEYAVDELLPRVPAEPATPAPTAEQTAAEIGAAQTETATPQSEPEAAAKPVTNDLGYNEAGLIQAELKQQEIRKKIATQYANQIEAYRARRQLELMRKNNGVLSKEDATRIEKEIANKFSLEKAFDAKRIKAMAALEDQHNKKAEREAMMQEVNTAFGKGQTFEERKEALYNLTHDESGDFSAKKATEAAILAVSSLAKQLEVKIDEIAGKKAPVDTRLHGSTQNKQFAGSYWDQLTRDMTSIGAINPYFKQEDFASSIESLVDKGIAFDLKQRAFLDTIHKKIATTFEVADGTLLRLVRIQQADSTAGRMGMEVVMNSFLNSMFETTEYLKEAADGVRGSLEEMQALMDGEAAAEVEFQAQKWLGSLYSVGMSKNAVDAIATALGQIGAGQIEGIANGGAGNLLVMAANEANVPIADILTAGLDSSQTNKLLEASVKYLAELADSAEENRVVQQQLANVFGVKASDLRAAQNLMSDGTMSIVSNKDLSYSTMLNELFNMAGTMHKRTSLAEMMTNLWGNVQYTLAGSIASNPITYFIYKMATVLDDAAGGIPLPGINIMGNMVELNTTVADLMRVASLSGGILGTLGPLVSGLSSSFSGRAMLLKAGIESGSGLQVLQRGNAGVGGGGGSSDTSGSGYVGNSSGSDVKDSTISQAESDKDKQMIEAQEEEEANKVDFLNEMVVKIYELLDDVANGDSSFRVKIDNYGLTKLGGGGAGSLSGVNSNSTVDNSSSNGGGSSVSGGGGMTRNTVSLGGWTG